VLSRTQGKTYTMLALALICMIGAALIVCQVHTAPSEPEIAHHHSHSSSGHTVGTFACLLAVLPFVALLIVFTSLWFSPIPGVLHYTSPIFPLFIPPRKPIA
jgi:hypothetical protein